MIAAHPDDARNYPIDMCWSREGIKGRRAVQEHHVLSRFFDLREASFDRVRADKNEQHVCESSDDRQMLRPLWNEMYATRNVYVSLRHVKKLNKQLLWRDQTYDKVQMARVTRNGRQN